MSEADLDSMLAEVGGSCNFDNMLKCFENKMLGEGMANDGDELVLEAMKAYNETSKLWFLLILFSAQCITTYSLEIICQVTVQSYNNIIS